jgi:hypothetical protein
MFIAFVKLGHEIRVALFVRVIDDHVLNCRGPVLPGLCAHQGTHGSVTSHRLRPEIWHPHEPRQYLMIFTL